MSVASVPVVPGQKVSLAEVAKPKPLPFHFQFLAGGIAGVAEIIAMYPLDVVKTRQQLEAGSSTGTFATLTRMLKDEGFGRMYRGVTAPVLVEAPKRATKFAANEQYKELIKSTTGAKELTRPYSVLAGVMAGVTEASLIVPFELVKVRMQDKGSVGLYKGPGDVVKHILKTDGLTGLYKGWEATCWRHGLWTGSYFGIIASVRAMLPSKDKMPGGELASNFAAGTIGGTIGTIVNTPADVVKSRVQNQITVPGQAPKYGWTLSAVSVIAREEGVGALYKGFTPKVLRLGPGGGILLLVYEVISAFIRKEFM